MGLCTARKDTINKYIHVYVQYIYIFNNSYSTNKIAKAKYFTLGKVSLFFVSKKFFFMYKAKMYQTKWE
jgi:hypothetical protein